LDEITEKYLNKAIPQLCKIIKFFKNSTSTIYPVLIVEDRFISKCEFWFKQELKKQLNLAEKIEVYPLIIISVETLELLPITVDLFSILKEYHNGKFTNDNIGANFCDYISSPQYKDGLYTSVEVFKLAENLLRSAQEKMFKPLND